MIRAGRYELFSVVTGMNRLDGGAMFGVVPKVLWSRTEDVDDLNRILMAMRSLVAVDRGAGRVIVVDTGAGSKWPAEEAARFAMEDFPEAIPRALAPLGFAPEDVTDIVATHLHFDHCGGMTVRDGPAGGGTKLRFPNASIWIHEGQWEHAHAPALKDRASYLDRDLRGLRESGRLRLVTGDAPVSEIPGLRWRLSHGHTPCQLLPLFEDDDRPVLFLGDMMPTASHLGPAWVMAYDNHPLTTIEERTKVYEECGRSGLAVAFCHDRTHGGAKLHFPKGKPSVKEPLDLDPPRA
ncbi:MAG: MBL fold metallo-hydrolase [Candidatus Eisenbacteria bacterium]